MGSLDRHVAFFGFYFFAEVCPLALV